MKDPQSPATAGDITFVDLVQYVMGAKACGYAKAAEMVDRAIAPHKAAELTSLLARLPENVSGGWSTELEGGMVVDTASYNKALDDSRAVIQASITAIEEGR